ncbi:hypothetical protein ACFQH3_05725 [Haladaptatus sp. GCM10025707]|uniref:DUF7529 family protein n=1 Tax=unclassified Haladaptatus TaxID=2622732 RepID=UPI0023E7923D|nr:MULTISPECIES: hypothetical protein [unclassified Haladaptatus]
MAEDEPETERPDANPVMQAEALDAVAAHWEDLIDDMEATAAEYRELGWEVVTVYPAQVFPDMKLPGFDILIADNDYAAAVEFTEENEVEEYDVYRAETDAIFFLAVMRDESNGRALLVPGYYSMEKGSELRGRIDDSLTIALNRLKRDVAVSISLEQPAAFFPEALWGE